MTNRLRASVSALSCHHPTGPPAVVRPFAPGRNNIGPARPGPRLRGMPSYRSLFRTPEFTPLFLGSAAQNAAGTVGGLALGTLVYRATGSPLLSAVSMFGPSLAQVLGATVLLSGADRLPPRPALTGLSLAFAGAAALMALPGLPTWGV